MGPIPIGPDVGKHGQMLLNRQEAESLTRRWLGPKFLTSKFQTVVNCITLYLKCCCYQELVVNNKKVSYVHLASMSRSLIGKHLIMTKEII